MNNKLYKLMNWPEIEEITYSDGKDPHRILGAHKVENSLLIQTFRPEDTKVSVIAKDGKEYEMEMTDESGFFAVLVPYKSNFCYSYKAVDKQGKEHIFHDPYNFKSLFTREDGIKFNSGIHDAVYKIMGSHRMERGDVKGVNFVVWAPDAQRVSVIGNFNGWDGRIHQMRMVDASGIFEIFIPEVNVGDEYQYEIKTKGNEIFVRPDPYAFRMKDYRSEVSIVSELGTITWEDSSWLSLRKKYNKEESALSICELSLDNFAQTCIEEGESTNYRNLAKEVIKFVKSNGFNAVELLPVCEHEPEHKYEVYSFFAIKSEYGELVDFMAFVNEMHKEGIRVILDWTPTYFPKRNVGLSYFDGNPLYEYGNAMKGTQPGTERLIFDYGRHQVTNFLIANALYFLKEFHIDGLRLTDISKVLYLDYDRAPGEWTPNIYGGYENLEAEEFFRDLTKFVTKVDDGILMITKETACWPHLTDDVDNGGLGFDYKWNNGWTRDFLGYMQVDPLFRGQHHNELTYSMLYSYTEKFILSLSHEDVGGYTSLKNMMPGDENQKEANVRMALAYMYVHPGRKMLYHGMDSLSMEKGLHLENFMYHLNMMYFEHPALYELDDVAAGFEWINSMAADLCMMSFVRKSSKNEEELLVVVNMAGVERELRVGVNNDGRYQEILNTDSADFGGNGIVNDHKIEAELTPADGRKYSVVCHMAPLSLAVFDYIPYTEKEKKIRKIREEAIASKLKEQEENRQNLLSQHEKEEARLLKELKEKYERELAQQQKAIEEKYEKIEEERIFAIVSEDSPEAKKTVKKTSKKTTTKQAAAKKVTAKKTGKTSSKKAAAKKEPTKKLEVTDTNKAVEEIVPGENAQSDTKGEN
ncbi:1,4-alpha-glucan branching enzyme [Butyrivibrio sp. NC3005]|uniref:1,4-alpha-glucan branching enzyme n=1 Tax=Butyrivibrio sp. NC3005 TaxID=1280685 RepID=UPI000427580A|nr:1,4-alpha-glucan branching enzyme [Butyrivibrio sp. NC3005]